MAIQIFGAIGCIALTIVCLLGAVFAGWKGGCAAFAAVVVLLIGVNPSTWLAATIFITIFFAGLQKRFSQPSAAAVTSISLSAEPRKSQANTPVRKVLSIGFKGLKETAIGICIGLTILVVVNLVVSGIDPTKQDLHGVEAGVLYLQLAIAEATSREWVVIAFISAVLLTVFWPAFRPVSRFVQIKLWLDRVALPLTIICTFTLYTAEAHASYEGVWALAHREEILKTAEAVKLWRRSALAAARVEAQLQQMPSQQRAAFTNQFQGAIHGQNAAVDVSRLGTTIGRSSESLGAVPDDLQSASGQTDAERAFQRLSLWIEDPASQQPPRRKDVEKCEAEASRSKTIYLQAREGLATLLEAQFEIPVENEYIKGFLDSLVGSTVDTSMEAMVPEELPDWGAARRWWTKYRSATSGAADKPWNWDQKHRGKEPPENVEVRPPDIILTEHIKVALAAFEAKVAAAEATSTARWNSRPEFVEEELHSSREAESSESGRRSGFEEPRPEPIRIPIE